MEVSAMNFDMIKYLPGYKGILKAVLKMQIQQLVFDFFIFRNVCWF